MSSFRAAYRGACSEGDQIAIGDEVTYVDDQLTHIDCAEQHARSTQAPCGKCWLVHRGECF